MKKNCLLLLALCVSLFTLANPVDMVTANSIAKKFLQSKIEVDCKARGLHQTQSETEVDMALVYEPSTESDASEYYVFAPSDAEGFVIVSGEDTMEPIIGYSLNGNFAAEQMPPTLEYLLSSYAQYVNDVRAGKATPIARAKEEITPVPPLITTTWDQGSPYNYYCPLLNGQRTLTGCVATATAQIMKYYEWPKAGHGTCTATLKDGNDTPVTITLGEEYDWGNMKNNYAFSYTETEAQAVRLLMRDVGHACKLNYRSDGTGGTLYNALAALVNNFDYSPTAYLINVDYYSKARWKEILYEELSSGRPILYDGSNSNRSAHAFVCCGIDQAGRYYFNWGWSGSSDGYYYLEDMLYNMGWDAVVGIKPIEEGESAEDYMPIPYVKVNFEYVQNSLLPLSSVINNITVYNLTGPLVAGQVGYAVFEDDKMLSSEIKVVGDYEYELLSGFHSTREESLDLSEFSDVPEGIREVRFFWRPKGSTKWVDCMGEKDVLYMKTTADGHSFSTKKEETLPTIPTAEIEEGTYYLKNVATGKCLTAAISRASTDKHGLGLAITQSAHGGYYIDTQIIAYTNENKHFLGMGNDLLIVNAFKSEWTFGSLGNDIYALSLEYESGYMSVREGSMVYTDETNPFEDEKAQWQLIRLEDMMANLNNASADNPVDATYFISGASFCIGDARNGNWKGEPNIDENTSCAQKWNVSAFDVNQTITDLPNGFYELRVQGFYREGGSKTADIAASNYAAGKSVLNAILYANEESTPLMSIMSEAKKGDAPDNNNYYTTSLGYVPQMTGGATAFFSEGLYQHALPVEITDGTLHIGVRKSTGAAYDWTCFDNFELYYYGTSILVPEYTVTFYDWDGTVLKTETVHKGQDATAPADPVREGYTFTGWDKAFTNVQADLNVYAVYTQNSSPAYTIEFNAGANGWIDGTEWHDQTEKIVKYASPLYRAQDGKVETLRFTVNRTKGNTKYFCLSELEIYDASGNKIALAASNVASNADHNALNPTPDGGGFAALFDGQTSTYFHSAWKNMPAEDHYLEITLPNGGYDAFSFKMFSRGRSFENGRENDQSHTFPGVMVMNTAVELVVGGTPEPEPEPEPKPKLDNDAVYYVSQPYNGGTSWAIAAGGSGMTTNEKLGITADDADECQQFAFISNDGGNTHYLYHPTEKKYVNKDNTLSATPRDPVYFKEGMYENTFVVYFDNDHVINTNSTDGLIINRWGSLSGWGTVDAGNSCSIIRVEKTVPEPQPELDSETLYYVSQPHHEKDATSWAVAQGGSRLQTNVELGIAADGKDVRQQFAFISDDGGRSYYVYHPAERKYVNMDGFLSTTPQDVVLFTAGAYDNTFVAYFDKAHFINVDQYRMLLVNDWGPGGRIGVADGGNSNSFTAVDRFVTEVSPMAEEGLLQVRKVIEDGELYVILPDGSKYTMTGVRMK